MKTTKKLFFCSFFLLVSSAKTCLWAQSDETYRIYYAMTERLDSDLDVFSGKKIDLNGIVLILDRQNPVRVALSPESFKKFILHPKKAIARGVSAGDTANLVFRELVYEVGEIQSTDHCLITNQLLNSDDICIFINGRRVTMKFEGLTAFLKNPEMYFSKLQPRGALFYEEMNENEDMGSFWLYFVLYAFIAFLSAGLTSHAAVSKGYSANIWFFAGLVFNLFALVFILLKPPASRHSGLKNFHKIPGTPQPLLCSHCGYENHPKETVCVRCHTPLKKGPAPV